ncbi:related to Transaminated amino acid decarboxylase [Zygosaccharomyces bailii ISA1307]|nr:related to Transaminated amino acid decarboxylase [Zygosaccharomyces bailii ISA1307]
MGPLSQDLTSSKPRKIPFGEYLFNKVVQCGSKSIFGVPGDYNLSLLEHLYDESVKNVGCRWIACCNELNAAYAADGYSRYTNKLGTLITTYGVGELSALNGVAGASTENVKVLHIVGVLKTDAPICNYHHLVPQLHYANLVGPNEKLCYEMVKDRIACSAEYLDDIDTATQKVSKVIEDIYKYSKPGYIFVPADFPDKLVDVSGLYSKISLEGSIERTPHNILQSTVDRTLSWLYSSKTPGILADANVDRFGLSGQLNKLIKTTEIRNFTTIMGKSILDEMNPWYMGLYAGKNCTDMVRSKFLSCDLILHFGVEKNEVNYCAQGFPYGTGAKVIEFHQSYIRFWDTVCGDEDIIKGANFSDVLEELLSRIDTKKLDLQYDPAKFTAYKPTDLHLPNEEGVEEITQAYLQREFPKILNSGDVLVCDTGSFQFGVRDYRLPSQVKYMAQCSYLSIGTALPASLGVGIGMQDYPFAHIYDQSKLTPGYVPKLILGVGDGAAQMTVQELTTMIRYQVSINVFLWNNNGYTIERAFLGADSGYNDIMPWKWTKLFEAFGDFDGKYSSSAYVDTREQLGSKIRELGRKGGDSGSQFIEVKMGTMDYPVQLQLMLNSFKSKP